MTRRTLLSLLPAFGSVPDGCYAHTRTGPVWITGQRFGSFLVHRALLNSERVAWNVTHIPTGLRCPRWALDHRASAVEIAIAIDALADWRNVRGKDDISPEVTAKAREIMSRIEREDHDA